MGNLLIAPANPVRSSSPVYRTRPGELTMRGTHRNVVYVSLIFFMPLPTVLTYLLQVLHFLPQRQCTDSISTSIRHTDLGLGSDAINGLGESRNFIVSVSDRYFSRYGLKAHQLPFFLPSSQLVPQAVPSKVDPFYGHEYITRLCARFIRDLFACPEYLPAPFANHTHAQSTKLPYFIAYALHRTKLHQSVKFPALVLLQRPNAWFPAAHGSSGHRLFISAFKIASKVMCDDTYSNKSWGIVAQGMFSL
jgi:hypothetical protein